MMPDHDFETLPHRPDHDDDHDHTHDHQHEFDDDNAPTHNHEEMQRRVQAALDKYRPVLMSIPGVVGVGIGYATVNGQPTDEIALVVMVDKKLPTTELAQTAQIPPTINGVRVDVQQMGMFTAF